MKRPAIFFDRDNTLIASDGYLGDPSGVHLIPGAADAIARARELGYATVVVSNQSGVARGMFGEEAVRAVNARVDELLRKENPTAIIDRHEFCPYHPQAVVERYRKDSDLRKPKPGMILHAAEKLALDLTRSWLIGDAPRDIEAGGAAGCRTILFTDPTLPESPAASERPSAEPDYTCTTLREAMDYIEQNPPPPTGEGDAAPPHMPADQEAQALAQRVQRMHAVGEDERDREADRNDDRSEPNRAEPSSQDLSKVETLLTRILDQLRHTPEERHDFSVSKLMAGIVQVVVFAVLFVAYLNRANPTNLLLLALVLQTLTISLLIMSRQK